MPQQLYSVEQVSERLGLNVRTVRGYVRRGRLKAVRIGKQYRIAREDLEAFTGRPVPAQTSDNLRRQRHVDVSSIVQIDAVSPDLASRITNGLIAAANARGASAEPLRVDTLYDEALGRLKVIATGGLTTVTSLLGLLRMYLE